MSFYKNISEIKIFWAQSGFVGRLILVMSSFFTLGSLTSISEVIVKWKGVFNDALLLYREFIFSIFGIPMPNLFIDVLTLISIYFFGMIRLSREEFRGSGPAVRYKGIPNYWFWILYVGWLICLAVAYLPETSTTFFGAGFKYYYSSLSFVCLLTMFYILPLTKFFHREFFYRKGIERPIKLSSVYAFYTPILLSVFLLIVFSQINKSI
jgi:hypothetical protein